MAKLEIRRFKTVRMLLVVAENKEESKLMDFVFGSQIPTRVCGEMTLADGYCEHYIALQKGAKVKEE